MGSGPPDPEAATPAPFLSGGSPAQGPLEVRVGGRGRTPVLCGRGEGGLRTWGELGAAIQLAGGPAPATLVLGLSQVCFLDSTGVRTLLKADARARDDGRRLVLI